MGKKPIPDPAPGYRLCTHCNKPIPLSELVSRVMEDGIRYARRCKPCNRAISRGDYWLNAELNRRRAAEWRRKNPDRKKAKAKEWNARSQEYLRVYQKSNRDNLSDSYVRARLARVDSGPRIISASDIPDELVALKRMQLLIKRQLKENEA